MKPKQKQDFIVLNRVESGRVTEKIELDRNSFVLSADILKSPFSKVKKYKMIAVDDELHQQLEKL